MLTGGDPLLGCRAVDLGLDRKDLVNAAHRLDGARRLVQIGQLEEFASAVRPAGCLGDRPRTALGLAQFAKPGIGVGLQDPGPAGEMPARMLTAAVARVAEQRRRRVRAGKRPVIANIDPHPAGDGLALGEHRNRGVVTMQTRSGEHVAADQLDQRRKSPTAGRLHPFDRARVAASSGRAYPDDRCGAPGRGQNLTQVNCSKGYSEQRSERRAGALDVDQRA